MLSKNLDDINEAFNGSLGAGRQNDSTMRIYWILNSIRGKSVLDIGCSQGITCILAGREGKSVVGIDVMDEAISVANDALSKEEDCVKSNVSFIADNFILTNKINQKFDTVLITEVLEHIGDSEYFVSKAYEYGKENSQYIITVPFGINAAYDHKKTYYFASIIKDFYRYLKIEEIKFLGNWIGFVTTRREEILQGDLDISFSLDDILKLEHAFYNVEYDLRLKLKRIKQVKNQNK